MDAGSGRKARDGSSRAVAQTGGAPGRPSGQEAEKLARRFLEARGLRMLAANYRCRYGELDLIMHDGASW